MTVPIALRRLAVLIGGFMLLAPAVASAQSCNRDCLQGLLTQYVDALVAGDHSALPVTDDLKFTEDSRAIELGEGLWETVTGQGGFRQDYIDDAHQVAASHIELREGDIPVLYSLVLHVEGAQIAGIETLVQRITPESPFQPTELGAPIRGMNTPVPDAGRMSREDMVATALTYTEGMRIGNFTDGGTPFAANTYRVENGVITAGEGCGRGDCGMYAQSLILHPSIIASVATVDEEAGIVVLWMSFGDTGSYGENTALITFEAFKVWGGEIQSVNAFFTFLPSSTSRFWASEDPVYAR